jgi:hypothetical protein
MTMGMNEEKGDNLRVYMVIIPAFSRLRQQGCRFEASVGYIVRPCLKKKKKN